MEGDFTDEEVIGLVEDVGYKAKVKEDKFDQRGEVYSKQTFDKLIKELELVELKDYEYDYEGDNVKGIRFMPTEIKFKVRDEKLTKEEELK